ncbi:MAG TPA: STAS domain-containing protein [Mycobacteriales bacterium]|nr:STAS domain-containing protein [Mycobacteriales bacterium]
MLGELQVQPTVTVLTLHGELDIVTVDDLRRLLETACTTAPDLLTVDLSDVPFIDVLSLSVVLAAADALREHGGNLAVVGASSSVRRVCRLLNAEDVLSPVLPRPRAAVL